MSVKGLLESEKQAKRILSEIGKALREQKAAIQEEVAKVQYLLGNEELKSWTTSLASSEKVTMLRGLLDETERLFIKAKTIDTPAATIFMQRMKKQLNAKLTNLKANELEVTLRARKLKEATQNSILEGMDKIRKEGMMSELYNQSRKAGGTLYGSMSASFGKSYVQDVVTLQTKAAGSKTIGEYMRKLYSANEQALKNVLVKGIVRGDSYKKMQELLMKGAGLTAGKAKILITTEANAIFNESVKQTIERNPLVAGYRFRAVLDSRTSSICQKNDGEYIPKDQVKPGVNYPPLHPNCRSTVTTVLVDEVGKADTMQRYTKDAQNRWVTVPPGTTYAQYKKMMGFAAPNATVQQAAEAVQKMSLASTFKERQAKALRVEIDKPGTLHLPIEKQVADQIKGLTRITERGTPLYRAVYKYTDTGSGQWNPVLREMYSGKFDKSKASDWILKQMPEIDEMASSLYEREIGEDVIVFRSTDPDEAISVLDAKGWFSPDEWTELQEAVLFDDEDGSAKIVDKIVNKWKGASASKPENVKVFPQFQSTSVLRGAFGQYNAVSVKMYVPKGAPGAYINEISRFCDKEYEIVLPPGVRYVVRDVAPVVNEWGVSKLEIEVEVIEGAYEVPEHFSRTVSVVEKLNKKEKV